MKNIWQKLKNRWKIDSDVQALIILSIFALTGFSTLYVHRLVDQVLGIVDTSSFWLKLLVFIFIVLPVFNTLLLVTLKFIF